jgi:hypothetical protein
LFVIAACNLVVWYCRLPSGCLLLPPAIWLFGIAAAIWLFGIAAAIWLLSRSPLS